MINLPDHKGARIKNLKYHNLISERIAFRINFQNDSHAKDNHTQY